MLIFIVPCAIVVFASTLFLHCACQVLRGRIRRLAPPLALQAKKENSRPVTRSVRRASMKQSPEEAPSSAGLCLNLVNYERGWRKPNVSLTHPLHNSPLTGHLNYIEYCTTSSETLAPFRCIDTDCSPDRWNRCSQFYFTSSLFRRFVENGCT